MARLLPFSWYDDTERSLTEQQNKREDSEI